MDSGWAASILVSSLVQEVPTNMLEVDRRYALKDDVLGDMDARLKFTAASRTT